MLKIFPWNFKGLSNSRMIDYIQDIVARLALDFLCLVKKKKINTARIDHFCDKFSKNWDWVAIPSNGFSGEITIFWQRRVGFVTPVIISKSAFSPHHLKF